VISPGMGLKVQLSYLLGMIAVRFEQMLESQRAVRKGHPVCTNAERTTVPPCEHGHSTWHTDGRLDIETFESRSLRAKPVQVGRDCMGISITSERIPPLLIGIE